MSKIVCSKCGKTGHSKCPYCRSIFGDDDGQVGAIDTIMSYRLYIKEEGILLKRYNAFDDAGKVIGKESDYDILQSVVGLLKRLTDEELKVISCIHEWEFAPCCGNSIGCGHSSEEGNSARKFVFDATMHLQRLEGDLDDGDVAACEVLQKAFDECTF